jgi:hypothetical protein
MKKLLGILIASLFAVGVWAGGPPPERYWFCDQAGYLEGQKVLFVSEITPDKKPNHYSKREQLFEKKILKDHKTFQGLPARCRDYTTMDKAMKFLKHFLKTAEEKYNFTIEFINFRY